MSRSDSVRDYIKTLITLTASPGDPITRTPVEVSVASLNGIDAQIALLFAELVDEICAIRKDLDELNQDIKRIERNVGKK